MLSTDMYTVVFRSADALINTNLNSCSYCINWGAILPKKYTKFKCSFSFISSDIAAIEDNALVSIDMGKIDVYNANSNINIIGVINANAVNYSSNINTNPDFTMNYPTGQNVTIRFIGLTGQLLTCMSHYALSISFTGIIDENTEQF